MRDTTDEHNTHTSADRFTATPFYVALTRALARRKLRLEDVCDINDPVALRLLVEYGAMFLASADVLVPPVCIFRSAAEVEEFQARAHAQAGLVGDTTIELQPTALAALTAAHREAQAANLRLTPRGGAEAARRSYADTVRLWASRVEPALEHWLAQECLQAEEVARVRALAPAAQVSAVLELEARGFACSKDFSKSILYSVAAPGASQHLALVAFDVLEFTNPSVRAILARHGWFQTVRSDLPHFTFLGVREPDLPDLGLARVVEHGQTFWLPAVE
jgi:hypothetical protein